MNQLSTLLKKTFPIWNCNETPETKHVQINLDFGYTYHLEKKQLEETFVKKLKEFFPDDVQLVLEKNSPISDPSTNPTGSGKRIIRFTTQAPDWVKFSEIKADDLFEYLGIPLS